MGDIDAFIQSHEIDDTRAYNLSKEAVIVETIATTEAFLAQGIRVNCVSPAAVSTGILDDFTKAFGPKVAKNIARAGRPGHPSEIADVILYLASAQSAWIKGQDITIDGGMSAHGHDRYDGTKGIIHHNEAVFRQKPPRTHGAILQRTVKTHRHR